MRVSLQWLREYVDIGVSPAELADLLSMSGTSVDRVIEEEKGLAGVVVGHVIEVLPHPNADNLRVALVDDGSTRRKVVCGAPNLEAGRKYALALPGAVLPAASERPIRRATIRGVRSDGMLCSGAEIGVSEDASGIFELGRDAPAGTEVDRVVSLGDVVFDLEITPNRPDCMSMVGIAREVAALTGERLHLPTAGVSEDGPPVDVTAKVIINDAKGCPRYSARVIVGAKVAESPPWMQTRLLAAGARPINNVVDVTNYVLLELGQPLHAFDLELLGERTVVVRLARRGELITTLDGVDRQLDDLALVIADIDRPVALAGIMGGEDSEVTEKTENILIESAYFEPTSIMRTSQRLGLRTEASSRFERGTDPEGTRLSADRAARLMADLTGGAIAAGEIDVYPDPVVPVSIDLRTERANRVLGTRLARGEMVEILEKLEMKTEEGEPLRVSVPSFRRDIEREIDLIEEIARIYGYHEIPAALPAGGGMQAGLSTRQRLEIEVIDALSAQGLLEARTEGFMRREDLDRLFVPTGDRMRDTVVLMNPLSETGEAMRTTITPGLLRVAERNANRGNRDLALFEKGRVFFAGQPDRLPTEVERVNIVVSGKSGTYGWDGSAKQFDFYDLKGVVENLAAALRVKELEFKSGRRPYLTPGRCAEVFAGGESAGFLGELSPEVVDAFSISGDFYVAELGLEPLFTAAEIGRKYRPVGRFPSVKLDIAVVIDEETVSSKVEDAIRRSGGDFLQSVRLFDVYHGHQIPQGKKSLAYAIEFSSADRTLTDEEVVVELERIIDSLRTEFGALIRGRERNAGEAT